MEQTEEGDKGWWETGNFKRDGLEYEREILRYKGSGAARGSRSRQCAEKWIQGCQSFIVHLHTDLNNI